MTGKFQTEFLILRDGSPLKLMHIEQNRAARFCRRLAARFPAHEWTLVDRFLPQGAD